MTPGAHARACVCMCVCTCTHMQENKHKCELGGGRSGFKEDAAESGSKLRCKG